MQYTDIKIEKPIFEYEGGYSVAVRASIVDKAEKEGLLLRITCKEVTCEISPSEWKKTGKKIEKVFKFPDHPMILYQNYVVNKKIEEYATKEEYMNNMSRLGGMFRDIMKKRGYSSSGQRA